VRPTTELAVRSLRHRATAFSATFLSIFLGTAVIGSFATLVQTATTPIPSADARTLTIMGAVVGGWGSLIVLFSVVSTVGLTVGQRAAELGYLRTIGATPSQARRLVRSETLAVATGASVAGAAVASLTGRLLLAALASGGLIEHAHYGGGLVSLAITVGGMLLVCGTAAAVAARRSTRGAPTTDPAEHVASTGPVRRWRVVGAAILIGHGLAMAVVTIAVTRHSNDPYEAMMTSGSSSIVVGVGLALLAPALLRWGAVATRPLLARQGAAGHLARHNVERRAQMLGGVLGPVIVLTAAAVGTLMAVGIDGRTLAPGAGADQDTITLLNNVVVGMLGVFAAIMVVNALVVVTARRRSELQRLRLLGAGPALVERSVVVEAAAVAAIGVLLGAVAALTTIVPFSVARGEGVVPDGQLWLPPLLGAAVVALTLAAARSAVRRVARPGLALAL
jgi:putative ABC transport system permease protein